MDKQDPVLGFFCRWVEEFAKHAERIEVICLTEGKYELPANVRVHSLGKEHGAVTRAAYAWRFLSLAWRLRHDYDIIFVHMNPKFAVLAGIFGRLWGKRIGLWYTHKSVNLKLRIAVIFAHVVFTASRESFRLRTKKLQVMGHGIDSDFFSPDASVARGKWILSVGRLMQSKRHDLAIRFAMQEEKELRIAGEGPERMHLEALASELGARVRFLGGVSQSQLRDEYRKAERLIHTSETGSLDKVVLEALACGLPVRTNDQALKALENANPAYVREHHSLQRLIPAILDSIQAI